MDKEGSRSERKVGRKRGRKGGRAEVEKGGGGGRGRTGRDETAASMQAAAVFVQIFNASHAPRFASSLPASRRDAQQRHESLD